MEQNRTRLTIINLLALLAAAVAGYFLARHSQSLAAYAVLPFIALGFVVSAVSYFHMRLVEREKLEQLEYDELTKSPSASTLFNKGENESLPAQRSRQQFEKFFLPGLAILLLIAEAAGVFFLWRWLMKAPVVPLNSPALLVAIEAIFFVVLFLLGRFTLSLSKLENQRLLRPVASFVLANVYLLAIVGISTLLTAYAGFSYVDVYVARALVILLGIIGIETLLTLLMEVYRPRVRGKEVHLLHDSRVMGLLAQPESLFTTAAHALDYQFGFAVSQTRFFQILQRQLAWIIAAQVLILVLSTTLVVIDSGEEALLERFGKPVASRGVIGPGLHAKFPWPIDKVHRYRTEQIQEFEVGLAKDDDHDAKGDNTVLWTVSHSKEEFNLLVASREVGVVTNSEAKKSPPVNLLSVGIPVQFQVTNLTAWAYNNAQPDQLLEKLATREVVRYLVSADLNEIMSTARDAAAEELRKRIQSVANERSLGARIVFVGLQDIHPPVAVAGAYEKVVGALQTREARILSAKAQAVETNAYAMALAYRTQRDAEADRDRTKSAALARAASFTNQLPAFHAAPSVYTERSYVEVLSRTAGNTRKYVLATSNTEDVILFNLEDKLRTDLLDVNIPAPRTTK